MQKEAQRNDRILAYGNRTLHMPERNFSSFKNALPGGILCFEYNVDKTYLQDLLSYQTLVDWKVGTFARQFVILLKLPWSAERKNCNFETVNFSKYYSYFYILKFYIYMYIYMYMCIFLTVINTQSFERITGNSGSKLQKSSGYFS